MRIVQFKIMVIAMKRGERSEEKGGRREERNKMQEEEVISNKITDYLLSNAQWHLLEYKLGFVAFFPLIN